MGEPRWTLCAGCLAPVTVTEIPAEGANGASWAYTCPACEWYADADACFKNLDWQTDAPPPPDPLAMLAKIVDAVVERAGRDAVATALGFKP
jgi:hypothetical protein